MSIFEPAPDHEGRTQHPYLKLALELGPLLVFFITNSRFGIFTGTAVFMVATILALAASWFLMRRLAVMPVVTAVVVVIFGSLTLMFHDDVFIKMKPTIVNTLFGATLLIGLAFGKSLLGYVFDSVFKLDERGWKQLSLRFGLFFLFLAVLNEVIWRSFSTEFWISFKVFGTMPLTFVFMLLQLPLVQRHGIEEPGKQA
ncbi:intracellular septation protein [Faunimonas pinastri]|uniref:Inner membrane-spanning protein YciB n=1 Tax=Faunimonas pinastri TaxID=1855383 RepID=A0A1H9MDG0_9HYPH|nr:septation protein A [Faunimonas pinastri]SER21718.1 intracellular septation protein [Faunimonas pinastri]